ncbi:hypothetical protein JHK82_016368 [Glycine max]|nr:hypothetical protein JHK85_016780 [Glycine max]KAG5149487.1 hypothetical protein JHK82_016368 [Glycine max]
MKKYFEQFGEILEAVVITDKATGRCKGYGFVTFREPEASMRACVDPAPIINGRSANCNLASLGPFDLTDSEILEKVYLTHLHDEDKCDVEVLLDIVPSIVLKPSLRQKRTQAEGETTITPWEYPFRDFSSTCESEQMLKRRTPNVKMKGRTSMDKWQRRSPQTRSPQCGCSHRSADQFDTKTISGRRRKKKSDRV